MLQTFSRRNGSGLQTGQSNTCSMPTKSDRGRLSLCCWKEHDITMKAFLSIWPFLNVLIPCEKTPDELLQNWSCLTGHWKPSGLSLAQGLYICFLFFLNADSSDHTTCLCCFCPSSILETSAELLREIYAHLIIIELVVMPRTRFVSKKH